MRRHITPSLIISLLALFIATSGPVTQRCRYPRTPWAPTLKKNAVTSKKVKDGSLRAKDFKGQLPQGPTDRRAPPDRAATPWRKQHAAAAQRHSPIASQQWRHWIFPPETTSSWRG